MSPARPSTSVAAGEPLTMPDAFTYRAQGRSLRGGLVVGGIWLALAGLWLGLQANPWIMGFVALFTLPACWDLIRNPACGLTLNADQISWFSGRHHGQVALAQIDQVRLDTRLDMSVRTTLVLHSGAKIRLPFEATPPHRQFEDALNAKGLKTRRTHFQLMQ
ncbi:MAG: hypothetical protein P8N14_17745 [Sulfitobacter sp.]|jgi:hypothetical protein|nr:hypothetical protein [Sulfitobacter sp.]